MNTLNYSYPTDEEILSVLESFLENSNYANFNEFFTKNPKSLTVDLAIQAIETDKAKSTVKFYDYKKAYDYTYILGSVFISEDDTKRKIALAKGETSWT